MPAFTCSSKMVHLGVDGKEHLYTANELSFVNGFPVFPNLPFHETLNGSIVEDDASLQSMLLGNGMCLMAETAWWLYIFAHVVRREAIVAMRPLLLTSALPTGSESDDDIPSEPSGGL